MKKLLNMLLVTFVFSFLGMISVLSADITLEAKGDNTNGKKFTVKVTNANGKILSYGSEYGISCVSDSCTNANSNHPYGKMIESDSDTFTFIINTKDYKVLSFNVTPNDGSTGSLKTTTFEINPSANTTTTTTTTKTVATTKSTTTSTTLSKSDNAFLKTLEVRGNDDSIVELSPSFKKEVYEYSMTVKSTIKTVIINATMEDSKAKIVYSNNHDKELKAGENNKITLTITSESGKQLVYTLNVKREALTTDATLKDLKIKEVPSFKLVDGKFSYNVSINKDVETLSITYLTNDENATVDITGNEDLQDGSKVKILVTAPDETKKEYVLTIKKEIKNTTIKVIAEDTTSKNPLIIMTLSLIGFTLIGSIIYVIKNK